jgi:hypothetical protein
MLVILASPTTLRHAYTSTTLTGGEGWSNLGVAVMAAPSSGSRGWKSARSGELGGAAGEHVTRDARPYEVWSSIDEPAA